MRYGILGPLVIRTGDEIAWRTVSAAKQRILIAALLLRANSAVPDQELYQLIWPGKPVSSAQVSLHTLVTRTRVALGAGAGERIKHDGSGYLIEAKSGELDLYLFNRAYDTGSRSVREGDWQLAAKSLREALDLWRGPLLADVPAPELRETHEQYLSEQRIQTLELRIEADLQLGSDENLTGEIRSLLDSHPMRERLHAHYMIALYRSGRRAEALAAFRAVRQLLVTELGIEPGSELRQLHRRMLADDPALARVQTAKIPEIAIRLVLATPRQLPPASRHFIGRQDALDALTSLRDRAAESVPIALIEGMAGVGKTSLAVHWAHRAARHFPDGQLFLNLRGFDATATPLAPGIAVRMFLESLGVPAGHIPSSFEAQIGMYRSIVSGKRMLIVLDNVRHADQVRSLLPGSPGSMVVVTSRLRIDSLVVVEGAQLIHLDVLHADDAQLLISDRLTVLGHDGTTEEVARLAALCGGLPLALSIAAIRVSASPDRLLTAVIRELAAMRRPVGLAATCDDSVRLNTVFSWSLDGLQPAQAQMFQLLGAHPGPDISIAAAASLADTSVPVAARLLRELTAANLLVEHREGHFILHDLLRSYAAELNRAAGEASSREALLRVCDHYLHTSHSAALLMFPGRDPIPLPPLSAGTLPEAVTDQSTAMAWFRAEHQVLLRIIELAADLGFNLHAWQLPWILTLYFGRTGCWQDWISTQEIALSAARLLGDPQAQARAHRALGAVQLQWGLTGMAHQHLQASLRLDLQTGDRLSEAHTREHLGYLADVLGQYQEALTQTELACQLYQDRGNTQGTASALSCIGAYHARLGMAAKGLGYCTAALELCAGPGTAASATVAWAWSNAALVQGELGDYQEAATDYRRAALIFQALGDEYNYAQTLAMMAHTCARMGDEAAAAELRDDALRYLRSSGHPAAETLRSKLVSRVDGQPEGPPQT
jgi:DNA-binding SARP family transcriptional activator/tetratricopeptide (TPR) repeat protein